MRYALVLTAGALVLGAQIDGPAAQTASQPVAREAMGPLMLNEQDKAAVIKAALDKLPPEPAAASAAFTVDPAALPKYTGTYRDAASGVGISLGVGVVYAIGSLIQLDLAARVCRPETAGTTFALLMSLTNLSAALSQGIGGWIYETLVERWGYFLAFQILVAVGALFTAGCWFLLPFLNPRIFSPRKPDAACVASGG